MVDSNQRPISMICNTCKFMEKMVSNRLLWELEALGVLSVSQFGFRLFRSTFDPLLMLDQNICEAFKEKNVFSGYFFTLKRHMILPGEAVFFVNYLTFVFLDSSLYLSKTFYLTGLSKYVLETPSLATMNSKRVTSGHCLECFMLCTGIQ